MEKRVITCRARPVDVRSSFKTGHAQRPKNCWIDICAISSTLQAPLPSPMASHGTTPPPTDTLDLGKDLPDDVFTIPDTTQQPPSTGDKPAKQPVASPAPQHGLDISNSKPQPSSKQDLEPSPRDRTSALQSELDSLRRINGVVSGLNSSLDRAKENMATVSATVDSASSLLDMWTRILSRTEHTQRLILNPAWGGAGADLAEAETEAQEFRREARKREEDRARREEERRLQLEEAEARRNAEASKGRARGRARVGSGGGTGSRGTGVSRGIAAASAQPSRGVPTTGRAAAAQYGRVRGRATGRGRG